MLLICHNCLSIIVPASHDIRVVVEIIGRMLLNLAVPIIIVVLQVDHDIRGFYVFHVFECG